MTTVKHRKRTARASLGPNKIHELCTGETEYCSPDWYDGYGDGRGQDLSAFISDEMRADWEANREALMAFWRSGEWSINYFSDALPHLMYRGDRRTLPWAARQFPP